MDKRIFCNVCILTTVDKRLPVSFDVGSSWIIPVFSLLEELYIYIAACVSFPDELHILPSAFLLCLRELKLLLPAIILFYKLYNEVSMYEGCSFPYNLHV